MAFWLCLIYNIQNMKYFINTWRERVSKLKNFPELIRNYWGGGCWCLLLLLHISQIFANGV
jgi:hypothetical protein